MLLSAASGEGVVAMNFLPDRLLADGRSVAHARRLGGTKSDTVMATGRGSTLAGEDPGGPGSTAPVSSVLPCALHAQGIGGSRLSGPVAGAACLTARR